MESKVDIPVLLNAVGVTHEVASQVAEKLRTARESKRQTLDNIAKELRLNQHILEVIENGKWDELPHGAPGRAFIRLYAKSLAIALPELDSFFEMKNTADLLNTHTNLENIIQYARVKHLENMSGVQKFIYDLKMLLTAPFRRQGRHKKHFIEPPKAEGLNKNDNHKIVEQIEAVELNAPLEKAQPISVQKKTIVQKSSAVQKLPAAAKPPAVQKLPAAAKPPAVQQPPVIHTNTHNKKAILSFSLGFLVVGTLVTAFFFTKNRSDEMDQFENSVVLENSSEILDSSAQISVQNTQVSAQTELAKPPSVAEPVILQPHSVESKTVHEIESNSASRPATSVVSSMSETPVISEKTAASEKLVIEHPAAVGVFQKMKIDILSPVAIKVDADNKSVFDGIANPGTMNFEFQVNAKLMIQDSSKVKLSYAGWENEPLSTYARKRVIVLRAKPLVDGHR